MMVLGIDKGKIIFWKVVIGLVFSVLVVFSIFFLMFFIILIKVIIIVGKNKYIELIIIVNFVYNKFSGCLIKFVFNNNVFIILFFFKMLI